MTTQERPPRTGARTLLVLLVPVLASCGDSGTEPEVTGLDRFGGTAVLAGGSVTLTVPHGALSEYTEFTAVRADCLPASGVLVAGSTWEIGPTGTLFDKPATLTVAYDQADVPDGVAESELRLHKAVGSSWEAIPSASAGTAAHAASGSIGSLGCFGVLELPVDRVDVSPPFYALGAGEKRQLSVSVKGSTGELLVARRVTWTSNDEAVATVDSLGWVTATGAGPAIITASAETRSSSVDILAYDCSAQSAVSDTECRALLSVFDDVTEQDWRASRSWVSDTDPCAWVGVTCAEGTVSGLSLTGQSLTGWIPSSLGDLPHLRALTLHSFSQGGLKGSIPSSIGTLTDLEHLALVGNELSGSIPPELGGLTGLTHLSLERNHLSGGIPTELGNLSGLVELTLQDNELSGSIPPELGGLTNLEELSLAFNQLSGPIPSELGALTKLQTLGLSLNELSGQLPPELGSLSSLSALFLSDNQLTGAIPAEMGNLTNLTDVNLWGNQLSGSVPLSVAQLGGLIQFNLTVPDCKFLPPGNTGLTMPDTEEFRSADLDGDGKICYVTIGS